MKDPAQLRLAALPVLALFCTLPAERYAVEAEPATLFGCELETAATLMPDEPVELRFTLTNRSAETLWVLTWYTPLEGLAGEILRVERDGEAVPYRGILADRSDPVGEDYRAIAAGESVSAVVDLTPVYDFSSPGTYRIDFRSRLHDVARREAERPRPMDRHQPQELECNTVDLDVINPES